MLMHVIAYGSCADTVRESVLTVDSGRKIPCCTRGSNPCQCCAWLFGWMLYQLSCPHPEWYYAWNWIDSFNDLKWSEAVERKLSQV